MSTQTQVALITGLAADLAIEIARILSERGFHLIVTETSESMMSLARDKLNGSVAPSDAFILDVCASADWDCAMDRACRKFGVPSLVFNLQSWSQNTEAAHEDAEICILGNYYGLHAAIPRMIGIASEAFFLGAGPTVKVRGTGDIGSQLPTMKLLLDTFRVFRSALHSEPLHTSLLLQCSLEERLEILPGNSPRRSLASPSDWALSVIEELRQDRFPIYSLL